MSASADLFDPESIRALFGKVPDIVAVLTRDARAVYLNPATERLLGRRGEELQGQAVFEVFPETVGEAFHSAFHQAVATRAPAAFEVLFAGHTLSGHVYPVGEQVWVFASDITDARRAERHNAQLRGFTDALVGASTTEELARAVSAFGIGSMGARAALVFLVHDGFARQVPSQGITIPSDFRRLPLGSHLPTTDAIRTRTPVLLRTRAALCGDYPEVAGRTDVQAVQALAALPLQTRDECIGALVLSFGAPQRFDQHEQRLYATVAHQLAVALDRARLFEGEREARERYRSFVAQSSEGIHRFEVGEPIPTSLPPEEQIQRMYAHGYLAEANDAMARMYGFDSAAEIVGMRLDQLLIPSDPRNTEYLRAFIESGYRIEAAESFELDRHGREHVFVNNLVGVVEHGALLRAWGTQRDVTERKHAEWALRRSAESARFLADAARILGASLKPDEVFRSFANLVVPRLADWCTITVREDDGSRRLAAVAHRDPAKVAWAEELNRRFPPSDNPERGVGKVFATGEPELVPEIPEDVLRASAKSAEHLELLRQVGMRSGLIVPMTVSGRTLGAMTLISAESNRRYAQEDVELARELASRAALAVENARLYREAERAIQVREEFLSVASHELKTPLTPLSLRLQSLVTETRNQPDSEYVRRVRGTLDSGLRQVHKLAALIGDLLDVSRIVSGRFRLEAEDADLAAIVREVVSRHEGQAVALGTALQLEAPESVPGRWDALRLEQVVTNLVDNAIKYGAGKPVEVVVRGGVQTCTLCVRDRGIGISPENQQRIFERFERAVSNRNYGGLGLGLYITSTIVHAMGGTIEVKSALGDGAEFTVTLPRSAP